MLGSFLRRFHQFVINRCAVRLQIVEPPEIKNAYPIYSEDARQLEAALQQFVLLLESDISAELIARIVTKPTMIAALPPR